MDLTWEEKLEEFHSNKSFVEGVAKSMLTELTEKDKKKRKYKLVITGGESHPYLCAIRYYIQEGRKVVIFLDYQLGIVDGANYSYCDCYIVLSKSDERVDFIQTMFLKRKREIEEKLDRKSRTFFTDSKLFKNIQERDFSKPSAGLSIAEVEGVEGEVSDADKEGRVSLTEEEVEEPSKKKGWKRLLFWK